MTGELDVGDFSSRTWAKLETTLEARLQELREMNDSPYLSDDDTKVLRGKIAFCKEILALPGGSARHEAAPGMFGDGIDG